MSTLKFGASLVIVGAMAGCASLLNFSERGENVTPQEGVWEIRAVGDHRQDWDAFSNHADSVRVRLAFKGDGSLVAMNLESAGLVEAPAPTQPTGLKAILTKAAWEKPAAEPFTFEWLKGYHENGRCQVTLHNTSGSFANRRDISAEFSLAYRSPVLMEGKAFLTPFVSTSPQPGRSSDPVRMARYGANEGASLRYASPQANVPIYLNADQAVVARWVSK